MLPITRVVLFKHGVALFQHSGLVEGDQTIELSFKTDQMNDVLKSLTTLDLDGGGFSALSYDGEQSMGRRLSEIGLRIPDNGAYSAFLDRLKGARVAAKLGSQEVSGAILGIERIDRAVGETLISEPHLAVLTDAGGLRRLPLVEVNELTLCNASLQRDLQALLEALYSSLHKDRKRMTIGAVGQGTRKVSLSYVLESPVWKTSYRLILPGDPKDKPLLQGWALVDNMTDHDWDGVQLSLVSGMPIAFVHDLYSPRYRERPVVEVDEGASVAPPVVEVGAAPVAAAAQAMEPQRERGAGPFGDLKKKRGEAEAEAEDLAFLDAVRESMEVEAQTQDLGELFAYDITRPVDVKRGGSALVPILQSEIDAQRILFYNAEIRAENPLTAFKLRNDTGLTLDGGPATVFEGASYVGEAMLETMRADAECVTPYSVELGVKIKRQTKDMREDFSRVTKHGTYIQKHYRRLWMTTYELDSRLADERTLYLDHRFTYADHVDTPAPSEVTDHFWRFKLAVPAGKVTTFSVTELSEQYESIHLPGLARIEVEDMISGKLIPKADEASLLSVADLAEEIRRAEENVSKTEGELKRIMSGQQRLRENLDALGKSTDEAQLRQRYVTKLAAEEDRIESLQQEVSQLRDEIEHKRTELERRIDAVELQSARVGK